MSPWKRFDEALHDLLHAVERNGEPDLLKLADKVREEFREVDEEWHQTLAEDQRNVADTVAAIAKAQAEADAKNKGVTLH